MNEEQIRQGLESGKHHPFPLLQRLAGEKDEGGARIVAEIGPEYLQGKERLRFQGLVRELTPEVAKAEETEMARRSEGKRQEHTSAFAASLESRNAATRERRNGPQLPSGGGWNLPLDA
jgi:hypothetical protein